MTTTTSSRSTDRRGRGGDRQRPRQRAGRGHRKLLVADVALISETAVFDRDVPSLCTGRRGLVALEVRVDGPSLDLHSGYFVARPIR